MDITKATILAALKQDVTGASAETATTIARFIRAGLQWLSEQGKYSCLHVKDDEVALAITANTIAKPVGLRILDCIVLNNGTQDGDPLTQTTFEKIKEARASTNNSGEPAEYVGRGANYELDRDCNQAYTAKVSYWRYDPDQKTILFGPEFEQALNYAVAAAYLDSKKQHSSAVYFWTLAEQNLPANAEDYEPKTVKYRDLG